jgi:hypothetical protein
MGTDVPNRTRSTRYPTMKEILLFFAILAAWFVLNRWVLPAMGVKT